jgi:L-ascorbate metabolism protein UlaG (beta-lactamase superfamily)
MLLTKAVQVACRLDSLTTLALSTLTQNPVNITGEDTFMQLTWYGHATLGIQDGNGKVIITDPHNPETSGYKPYETPADLVLMSSAVDDFHNNGHLIPGNPEVVNTLEIAMAEGGDTGSRTVQHVDVSAIAVMEVHNHPTHDPEQNAMYRFEVDGISVGHTGDAGNPLTENQLEFFQGVDVLLALAGGYPTLAMPDLKVLIDHAKPKLVVPMHFRTLRYKPQNSFWITEFLQLFEGDAVDFACDSTVKLTKESLPSHTRALVLDYV